MVVDRPLKSKHGRGIMPAETGPRRWDNAPMKKIHPFGVYPHIPARLSGLEELAYNLRWTWDTRTYKLFQHLDPDMLEKCQGNPVLLLRRMSHDRLEHAANDSAFLAHLDAAVADLRRYLAEPGWLRTNHPEQSRHLRGVLLHGIRADGLSPHLFRWSGRPGRRPSQVGQRARYPSGGGWAAVSPRLLRPVSRRQRVAARALSHPGFRHAAHQAGHGRGRLAHHPGPDGGRGPRRHAAQDLARHRRPRGQGPGVEGAGRPYPAVLARHPAARERPGIAADHQRTLRRRP